MKNKQIDPKGSRGDPPIACPPLRLIYWQAGIRLTGSASKSVIGNVVKQSDGIKEVKQENEY